MSLKKQTNKQKLFLLWRQLETLLRRLHAGLSGSFCWSLSCPPKALWLAWGGALGTGHSLPALVLQECSTTLKRRGSCSKGTFTIFPGDKVGKEELAAAAEGRASPSPPGLVKGACHPVEWLGQGKRRSFTQVRRMGWGPDAQVRSGALGTLVMVPARITATAQGIFALPHLTLAIFLCGRYYFYPYFTDEESETERYFQMLC